MKILSKKHTIDWCDVRLNRVRSDLQDCIKIMKGKYGTSEAVSNLECAMIYVNPCISDDKYHTKVYQQFRNPPNTPKSRRLGWHKKGVNDEQ